MPPKNKQKQNYEEEYVPIPIQFFFWNQTGLFIKHKFGNLTEAHAMNFERVLVQNILHGLSPGLSDAISSISRWKLVRASFPYITHACFASLFHKKNQTPSMKLSKADIKLLYTLNWLILDAITECITIDQNNTNIGRGKILPSLVNKMENNEDEFLYSIAMIQLFIYLFIPILKNFDDNELNNQRLSNGLKIWEPLLSHRQPEIQIFNTSVKRKNSKLAYIANDLNDSFKNVDDKQINEGISQLKNSKAEETEKLKMNAGESLMIPKSVSYFENISKNFEEKISKGHSELSLDKINSTEISTQSDSNNKSFDFNNSIKESRRKNENSFRLSNLLIETVGDDIINDVEPNLHGAPLAHMSSICSFFDTAIQTSSPGFSTAFVVPSLAECNKKLKLKSTEPSLSTNTKNNDLMQNISYEIKQPQRINRNNDIIKHSDIASFFDIALIRCIFSSKWHSEGYIWSLEYLHNRMLQITDDLLKEHDDTLKIKTRSFSFPNLKKIDFLNPKFRKTERANKGKKKQANSKAFFDTQIKHIKYIDEEKKERNLKKTSVYSDLYRTNIQQHPNSNIQSNLIKKNSLNKGSSILIKSTPPSSLMPKKCKSIRKRSSSDSNMLYNVDFDGPEEVIGSTGFINNDGSLNLDIILKSIHAVTYKENSTKICELTLSILESLLNVDLIPDKHNEICLQNFASSSISSHFYAYMERIESKYTENFSLALNVALRNIKWLSCGYCRNNTSKAPIHDQLRNKVKFILVNLQKKIQKDLTNAYSMKPINPGSREEVSKKTIVETFNIFEKSISNSILTALLKPLLKRIIQFGKSLSNHENIYLFMEVRNFLSYLKENHKNIFYRVIFSSMLDPMLKLKKEIHKELTEIVCSKNKQDNFKQYGKLNESSTKQFEDNDNLLRAQNNERTEDRSPITKSEKDDSILVEYQKSLETLHKKQMINFNLLIEGLNFYRLLVECSPPASVPDISFMTVFQDLEAPVISKISFIVETSLYVSQYNRSGSFEWIKMNMGNCRTLGSLTNNKNASNTMRKNKFYQMAIAELFFAWGEVLTMKLESKIDSEEFILHNKMKSNSFNDAFNIETYFDKILNSENKDHQLEMEVSICALLFEVSSFIREIYPQIIKKTKNTNQILNRETKHIGSVFSNESSSVSMLNESYFQSEVQQNVQNSNEQEQNNDMNNVADNETTKHISFACQDDPFSTENLNQQTNDLDQITIINNSDPISQNQNTKTSHVKLANQSKRSSLKQIKKTSVKYKMDRGNRLTRRKLSHSYQTDIREQETNLNTGNISDGDSILNIHSATSNTIQHDVLNEGNESENLDTNKAFPWIKVVIKILEQFNFDCSHVECESNCFFACFKRSKFSMEAILRLYEYGQTPNNEIEKSKVINTCLSINGKKCKDSDRKVSVVSANSQNLTYINNFLHHNSVFYGHTRNYIKILSKENIHPTSRYLKNQIQNFIYMPLELLCKCAIIIPDEFYISIIQIVWNLLLVCDEEILSAATTLFLIAGIKQPVFIEEFLQKEFKSNCVKKRYNAILKFQVIWRFRYHLWPHLEANAHYLLKITPPCIEFILPSPAIGQSSLPIIEPPWLPKPKKNIEVAVNQEEIRAVVTASKSRKKYQQEVLSKAMQAEEKSKRIARETFTITTIPYLQFASYEPLLHQNREDQNESIDEVIENLNQSDVIQSQAVFPTSIATSILYLIDLLYDNEFGLEGHPINELSEKVIRGCLIDDSALFLRYFFEKITQKEKKDIVMQYIRRLLNTYLELPLQTAHMVFNYLLGVVMFYGRTPTEGSQDSVSSIMNLLWQLVANVNGIIFKDLKQILKKEQCDPLILITANVPSAKKLIIHGPDLSQIPTQLPIQEDTRFSFVMQECFDFFSIPESKREKYFLFDVKSSQIHLPDTYVRDFYFFRRNYYPQLTMIPIDFKDAIKLLEKSAFGLKTLEQSKVLYFQKILDNAPFSQVHSIGLFLLEELNKIPTFPRKALEADFNLYSKISDRELSTMDMLHKYSWLKLIWSLFSSMESKTSSLSDITIFLNVINGAFVLHCEDLNMLRSCLAIYINVAKHFQQIFSTNGFLLILPSILKVYSNMQTNQILKRSIEFTCSQFFIMHRIPFLLQLFGSVTQMIDINNVNNNYTDANKVQASYLFSLLIGMEQDQNDDLKIIDLTQLLESRYIKPIKKTQNEGKHDSAKNVSNNTNIPLNTLNIPFNSQINTANATGDTQVGSNSTANNSNLSPPSALLAAAGISTAGMLGSGFVIGGGLNNKSNDNDRINIKPLDFCYSDLANNKFSIIDAINLCVTVIAYATHANRAYQMILILDVIIPQYMEYLQNETEQKESIDIAKKEYDYIYKISLALKTMINSVDLITRNFIGPKTDGSNSSYKKANPHRSPSILPDEDSMRFYEDRRTKQQESDDKKQKNDLFLIRDLILQIASEFIYASYQRYKETDRLSNTASLKIVDLFDVKTHNKLTDIAHSLLKQFDDAVILNGHGLQSYFQKLLPLTDWTQDPLRGSLNNLLRRIDRSFKKLIQRSNIKKHFDWNAAAKILNGLYLTIEKQENISQLPFFKTLINSLILLTLNENVEINSINFSALRENDLSNRTTAAFVLSLIKLIGRYISSFKDQENLEQLFTIMMTGTEIQSATLGMSYLVNFLMPLLLWNSSIQTSTAKLSGNDMSFATSMILSSLKISSKIVSNIMLYSPKPQIVDAIDASLTRFQHIQNKSMRNIKDTINQAAFLGLKIVHSDFIENVELAKIATTIGKMCSKIKNNYLWKFFEFVCTYRNPLFLLLRPFIEMTITSHCFENEEDFKISKEIQAKLNGSSLANNKSKIKILSELSLELESMKKDFKASDRTVNPNFKHDSVNYLRVRNEVVPSKKFEDFLTSPLESYSNAKKTITKPLDFDSAFQIKIHKKFEKIDSKEGSMILETYLRSNDRYNTIN